MRTRPILILLSCQAVILAIVLTSNAHARKLQAEARKAQEEAYTPPPEHCPLEPPVGKKGL